MELRPWEPKAQSNGKARIGTVGGLSRTSQRDSRRRAEIEVAERLLMAVAREGLVPTEQQATGLLLATPSGLIWAPVARYHCMARFDLAGLPRELNDGKEIATVEELLGRLLPELAEDRRRELTEELSGGRDKVALSLEALERFGSGEVGEGSLADWEGRVWLGHPLHPGFGLRRGVTEAEHRAYGPEWQAQLCLPLLEIPRDQCFSVGSFHETFQRLFPSLGASCPQDRVLLPVHPWQAERDLPTRFASRFASGDWRIHEATVPARPTMSFRSVILQTEIDEPWHLKLPVNVQTTGAVRTVSVAAAQNGPRVSAFLKAFVQSGYARDSRLFERFHLMYEEAAFYLDGSASEESRFLAGLLRRGVPVEGAQRCFVVPVAALMEPRESPLFVRLAEAYGLRHSSLWTLYLASLLRPLAILTGRFGICLEAHPQNLLVEFRGELGRPPKIHFWYRDFGGIRFHEGRLREALAQEPELAELKPPEFWPGSATTTDCFREASSKFIYSVLQNHLGELIRAVVRRPETPTERRYWAAVAEELARLTEEMGPELAERVFAPRWDLKAMWTMRVDQAVTEYTFAPVVNPLLPDPPAQPPGEIQERSRDQTPTEASPR